MRQEIRNIFIISGEGEERGTYERILKEIAEKEIRW